MKRIKVLSALFMLFTAIGFTSCGDDSPELDGSSNGNSNSYFKVNFSEDLYTATTAGAEVHNGMITITGTRGQAGEAITMTLTGNTLGTYTDVTMSYITGAEGTEYVNVNPETGEVSGTIKITGVNTSNRTISGKFSFRGWDAPGAEPIAFYNGTFENIPYTGDALPEPLPEPVPGDEYYRAKIAGVATELNNVIDAQPLLDQYALVGSNGTKSIDIRVPANIVPGTYEITEDMENGIYAMHLDTTTENGYGATAGTLVIVENGNGWIKGTFEFTGADIDDNTIEITEGQFNIQLP